MSLDNMSVEEFVAQAEKDRYALIIPEALEQFAEENLREIYEAYPCTGILVRRKTGGIAYHVTAINNAHDIMKNGLQPSFYGGNTYGAGVIYAYPSISCYTDLSILRHAVFELRYKPGCLQAIATFDKEDREQGEILIFPEQLMYIRQVQTW